LAAAPSTKSQAVAINELSRLWDPFSVNKRRFRVAIFFNEERVDIPCLDSAILELAHALVTGEYVVKDGVPRLNWICGVEI
jgi:hypothetical protein